MWWIREGGCVCGCGGVVHSILENVFSQGIRGQGWPGRNSKRRNLITRPPLEAAAGIADIAVIPAGEKHCPSECRQVLRLPYSAIPEVQDILKDAVL